MKKKIVEMTTQEKKLLLSKLLRRVKIMDAGYSCKAFEKASVFVKVTGESRDENGNVIERKLEKAPAARFYKYLLSIGYIEKTKDGKGRNCIPVEYRKDESDLQMEWLSEVVQYHDPFKTRGRIKGVSPRRKETSQLEEDCSASELLDMEEVPEGYILNQETGIWEEPIIPEDSLDNYDSVTGEWKTLPGEDDVTLIGEENHIEDSVSKVLTDLAPIIERGMKVGLIISVHPVIK